MKFLLDTCVISEIIRPRPAGKVLKWFERGEESTFFLSVLTFGELHKGIEKLPESNKRATLNDWVENDLKERFRNRIIDIDLKVAESWGKLLARAETVGRRMPAIDSLIAATGIAHRLTVVTRNIADMKESGVALLNPWEG